ncbi:hypothetical protein BCR37DRAFT_394821 [Protomyces lactucae-debilis]|uniref:Uncharacterized protein n=1 Tax=Protomyces lactucae-debilis TaxID=2754530 RepID=A0A1Y2F1J6_PROLT|nr:uncharacterized protein BCR37DRAFT_394821 [Protomyces lactucae-debilis]ORY77730.1 hypothetical protein BCR37DRAFT_394821 [Protomyces lactucae-debilis]
MSNEQTPLQMEDEILARSEGLHPGGLSRSTPTNSANNGKLEGNIAGAPASVGSHPQHNPAVLSHTQQARSITSDKPHVSLGDKIKGQAKVIAGAMKHDVNLAQEGEDLKAGDKDRLH